MFVVIIDGQLLHKSKMRLSGKDLNSAAEFSSIRAALSGSDTYMKINERVTKKYTVVSKEYAEINIDYI